MVLYIYISWYICIKRIFNGCKKNKYLIVTIKILTIWRLCCPLWFIFQFDILIRSPPLCGKRKPFYFIDIKGVIFLAIWAKLIWDRDRDRCDFVPEGSREFYVYNRSGGRYSSCSFNKITKPLNNLAGQICNVNIEMLNILFMNVHG